MHCYVLYHNKNVGHRCLFVNEMNGAKNTFKKIKDFSCGKGKLGLGMMADACFSSLSLFFCYSTHVRFPEKENKTMSEQNAQNDVSLPN